MVQAGELSVKVTADIQELQTRMDQVDKRMAKSTKATKKSGKAQVKSLKGVSLGYLGLAAASLGVLLTVAKHSAIIGSFMGEFNDLLGEFGDIIGETLSPVIEPLLDLLSQFIDWFEGAPGPVKALVAGLTVLAVVIPIVSLAFLFMTGTVIPAIMAGLTFLAAHPIVLFIILLAALIIFLALAWSNNWGDIQGKVMWALDKIKGGLDWIWGKLKFFFAIVKVGLMILGQFFKRVFGGIQASFKFLSDKVKFFLDVMKLGFAAWKNVIKSVMDKVMFFLKPVLKALGFISDNVGKLGKIKSGAKGFLDKGAKVFGFAEGGFVKGPTLGVLGEKEPEFAIPQSKIGKIGGTTINLGGIHFNDTKLSSTMDIDTVADRVMQRVHQQLRGATF